MNTRLRNYLLTLMGVAVTLASLIYIGIQYSKLLSTLLTSKENAQESDIERKYKNRFKQIENEEGLAPATIEEDDLSADIGE